MKRDNIATLVHADQVALPGLFLRDLGRNLQCDVVPLVAIDANLSNDGASGVLRRHRPLFVGGLTLTEPACSVPLAIIVAHRAAIEASNNVRIVVDYVRLGRLLARAGLHGVAVGIEVDDAVAARNYLLVSVARLCPPWRLEVTRIVVPAVLSTDWRRAEGVNVVHHGDRSPRLQGLPGSPARWAGLRLLDL